MNKKQFFTMMMMTMLPLSSINLNAASLPVDLHTGYNDPVEGHGEFPRGPIVPELSIDEYELLFDTSCIGYTLQLIDENDNVVYSTVVTSNSLVLPSTLSGEYEILLLPNTGSIYFFGTINL